EGALIIAADSGYKNCAALGCVPDIVLGDFDSLGNIPEDTVHRVYPKEKDDTDLMLAAKEALSRGCDEIVILGALGGRFDHTFANIQALGFIAEHGADGMVASVDEDIMMVFPGINLFRRDDGRSFSLFAFSDEVKGLTIEGVKYPLKNACITNRFPIGISNEITADHAVVSFTEGLLLVVMSKLK
ncbi:MAG: thiamine diphosphokinase, partial [Ruminococcus sp.]|nr:thiamine diphosphokinase [Ruminococcus sp.]